MALQSPQQRKELPKILLEPLCLGEPHSTCTVATYESNCAMMLLSQAPLRLLSPNLKPETVDLSQLVPVC